jgi:outer membrane protein assembly factor BamD
MNYLRKHIWLGFLFSIVIALGACSKYNKVLKSNDYKFKYRKAVDYFNDGKYVKAATLLDQVKPIFKATDQIDSISYYYAYCQYKQRQYIMAAHYFKDLAETYPRSPFTPRSDYMFGYCYYVASPKYSLDQDNSERAIQALREFIRLYPDSEKVDEAKLYISELRNKLVKKSFESAKLYYKLEEYKAAIIALNNSLNEYPGTKYREEIMYLILESNFILAERSIIEKKEERYQNTVYAYYSFIEEFPESKYIDKAKTYFEKANHYIN